ncbi:MAG: lipid-A-disaccharide synthase [Tannerella sp.]|jgi:lipid-A-disaccharide synthase|nr:lipid-A-disaccharide synthase [Tannerella sp.]
MKYYLLAGEASGDLHASNLMKALMKEDPEAQFQFFGGDLMHAAGGGTLVKHYREMAYMGLVPVLLHLRTILRNMQLCRRDIRSYAPDAVILIDYPGFNLRIARFVKTQLGTPVYYYISPKIWAWKKYRIKSLRRYVDRLFCILPFEVDFFKSLDYPAVYVGNPSVDAVSAFLDAGKAQPDTFAEDNGLSGKPLLAILAGSRKAEIRQNLPLMLSVAAGFPEYRPVIAGAPGLTPADYGQTAGKAPGAAIVYGQTYPLLRHASAALVTSGTATLETALFRVPQAVCYHTGWGRLANFVFDRFFHVPFISLVNLIAGKEVVQELFGVRFSYREIRDELEKITGNPVYRNEMLAGYGRVISRLGQPGASGRTAKLIVESLKNK